MGDRPWRPGMESWFFSKEPQTTIVSDECALRDKRLNRSSPWRVPAIPLRLNAELEEVPWLDGERLTLDRSEGPLVRASDHTSQRSLLAPTPISLCPSRRAFTRRPQPHRQRHHKAPRKTRSPENLRRFIDRVYAPERICCVLGET